MADGNHFSDVRFLTVAEVAELMRVSKMTVYRLVHAGDLPVGEFLHRAQVDGQSESA